MRMAQANRERRRAPSCPGASAHALRRQPCRRGPAPPPEPSRPACPDERRQREDDPVKLFYSPTSPYVRKVMACAIMRGIEGRIEKLPTNPHQSPPELLEKNPLSK